MDGIEPHIDYDANHQPIRVWVSAQTGQGIDLLYKALTERLGKSMVSHRLRIPPAQAQLRGVLYGLNCIASESYADDGDWLVDIRMQSADWQRLEKHLDNGLSTFVIKH
jgi:GTP-binding protein HflX